MVKELTVFKKTFKRFKGQKNMTTFNSRNKKLDLFFLSFIFSLAKICLFMPKSLNFMKFVIYSKSLNFRTKCCNYIYKFTAKTSD